MICIHVFILELNAVAKYKIVAIKKHHYIFLGNGVCNWYENLLKVKKKGGFYNDWTTNLFLNKRDVALRSFICPTNNLAFKISRPIRFVVTKDSAVLQTVLSNDGR